MNPKFFLTICGFLLSAALSYSQMNSREATTTPSSNFTWHKISFEVKDVSNPDPALVNQIPLQYYEEQRLPSIDVEIEDPISNYTIILYSDEKCRLNKAPNNNPK